MFLKPQTFKNVAETHKYVMNSGKSHVDLKLKGNLQISNDKKLIDT